MVNTGVLFGLREWQRNKGVSEHGYGAPKNSGVIFNRSLTFNSIQNLILKLLIFQQSFMFILYLHRYNYTFLSLPLDYSKCNLTPCCPPVFPSNHPFCISMGQKTQTYDTS